MKQRVGECGSISHDHAASTRASPFAAGQRAAEARRAQAPKDLPPTAAVYEKARILIADESRIVRAALARCLRDRFDVREAADGEAAWQAILLDPSIRIALVDLTLPRVDGFQLISRARTSRVRRIRELPLLAIGNEDEQTEGERATTLGAAGFVAKGIDAGDLNSRLDKLLATSATRENSADGRAADFARDIVADTELPTLPKFDRQLDRLISCSRRDLTDLAIICIGVEVSTSGGEQAPEPRLRMLARSLKETLRPDDLATQSEVDEICVAARSDGVAQALHLAARLRKALESVDPAHPGVDVWTFIGVACLSEDTQLTAEQLRQVSQKRAGQAKISRSRRIVLGAGDGDGADRQARADAGSMDITLALTLIRSGRAAEVVPHLPRLLSQLRPLLKLARQQKERELTNEETVGHGNLPGVPRPLDP